MVVVFVVRGGLLEQRGSRLGNRWISGERRVRNRREQRDRWFGWNRRRHGEQRAVRPGDRRRERDRWRRPEPAVRIRPAGRAGRAGRGRARLGIIRSRREGREVAGPVARLAALERAAVAAGFRTAVTGGPGNVAARRARAAPCGRLDVNGRRLVGLEADLVRRVQRRRWLRPSNLDEVGLRHGRQRGGKRRVRVLHQRHRQSAVQQGDGNLVITTTTAGASSHTCSYPSNRPCQYTSARIAKTLGKFNQQYGRFTRAPNPDPRGAGDLASVLDDGRQHQHGELAGLYGEDRRDGEHREGADDQPQQQHVHMPASGSTSTTIS